MIILLLICLNNNSFFQPVQEVKVLLHLLFNLLVESRDVDKGDATGYHGEVDRTDSHKLCDNFRLSQFSPISVREPDK